MRLRLEWYLYDVETYGTLTIGCGSLHFFHHVGDTFLWGLFGA